MSASQREASAEALAVIEQVQHHAIRVGGRESIVEAGGVRTLIVLGVAKGSTLIDAAENHGGFHDLTIRVGGIVNRKRLIAAKSSERRVVELLGAGIGRPAVGIVRREGEERGAAVSDTADSHGPRGLRDPHQE